jgi:hypothetical protein
MEDDGIDQLQMYKRTFATLGDSQLPEKFTVFSLRNRRKFVVSERSASLKARIQKCVSASTQEPRLAENTTTGRK